jgi:imidazolonepropionase-like amidohydrolase
VDTRDGKLIANKDVLLRDGVIRKIGAIPRIKGVKSINGKDKYLMPGMADAHIHFFQSGGLYTRPDAIDLRHRVPYEDEKKFGLNNAADYLQRYLRLGITTVIDVGGPMSNFVVRDSIAKSIISPNVLVTGPLLSTIENPVFGEDPPIIKISNREDVDAIFEKILPHNPDFIKIWGITGPDLTADEYYPILEYISQKTHEHGLKLTVHATELYTAQLAVQAGANVLVHSVGDELIPDSIILDWKERDVTYIPTLVVSAGYYRTFSGTLSFHPQDLACANPFAYGTLTDLEGFPETDIPVRWRAARKRKTPWEIFTVDEIANQNLVNLLRAGVNVATGTDAGNIGTMHASSYIQEQEAMQKAGLTNAEILKASTINVAHGFGKDHLWGTVDEGKQADLVLLNANPFESLQNLNAIELIFKDGKILHPDSIVQQSPASIVQQQVNAINARNLGAFITMFHKNAEVVDAEGVVLCHNRAELESAYIKLFESTPDLYYGIENRTVTNNGIRDQIKVRENGIFTNKIHIYEVREGKIIRMTIEK